MPTRKIYVIYDNTRYYRAKIVTEYLATPRINYMFLMIYSLKLNLVEMKQEVLSNHYRQRFIKFKGCYFDFLGNFNIIAVLFPNS
ncbi:MAG: hypothetical protein RL368_1237 [Pseudomonadota bacterium]|jgi:hypothetical protein